MMNIQSSINREIFTPRGEKLLLVIEVRKRRRRRLTFGHKSDYATFLCLSVTNRKPPQVFLTKVKRYEFSPGFEKRSQWSLEELRRVDGVDPEQDSPEFDLVFDRVSDQWIAGSTAEKCMFVQTLYQLCQNYWRSKTEASSTAPPAGQNTPSTSASTTATAGPSATSDVQRKKRRPAPKPTEFINCQAKLLGDSCSFNMLVYRCKIFLNRMRSSVTSAQDQTRPGTQKTLTGKASRSRSSSSPPAPRIMGTAGQRTSSVLSERGGEKQLAKTSKSG
ncbi:syntaxin binding protein 6 (amisyn), like [Trichomycterus rosablanca]|uniref:syntaxin binding protein 6 (amisyn), like n=1 Tax=Trichomycterus rosablanca TaxID=2290929 RepID=UPI002F358B29